MVGQRLRRLREHLGLSQGELATRAGVSRQLVGALEAGRHLPRVDAALALAAALGTDAATLFGPISDPVDAVSGHPPREGSLVRVGVVGGRTVVTEAGIGADGWDVADAVIEQGEVQQLAPIRPSVVIAGCEPGLEVLERLLRETGLGAVSVACSSAAAAGALAERRVHAAVVHAGRDGLGDPPAGTVRFHLCRWQVGLAGPSDAERAWFDAARQGRVPVVQREAGAGVQTAFEQEVGREVPGPRVAGHLAAARWAVSAGMPAVTMEPAALALGASFSALETHEAEIWVRRQWLTEPAVEAALVEVAGRRFQRRLEGIGGYDLEGCGTLVA